MNTIENIIKTKSLIIEQNRKLIKTFKELNNDYYNLFVRIYRGVLVHALQWYIVMLGDFLYSTSIHPLDPYITY